MSPMLLLSTFLALPALPTAPVTQLVAAQAQGGGAGDKATRAIKELRIAFGYNDDKLAVEYRDALAKLAKCVKDQPELKLTVAGHADDRGSTEFNLALGERRAITVRRYLETLGVPPDRLRTLSYGEERPLMEGKDEAAWAANRRAEFEVGGRMVSTQLGGEACFEDYSLGGTDPNAPKTDPNANADKDKDKDKDKNKDDGRDKVAADDGRNKDGSGESRRMFPWLPIWVGPLVMALAVPPALLALPFIGTLVYLGPQVWSSPNLCQEPVHYNGGSPTLNGSSTPMDWCGSVWSLAQHAEERPLAGAVAGVGVIGTLLMAGAAVGIFATGAVLLVMALLPSQEKAQPAAAPTAASANPDRAESTQPAGDAPPTTP